MAPVAILFIVASIFTIASILLREYSGHSRAAIFICMLVIVFLDSAFVFQRFRVEDYGFLNWAVLGLGVFICLFFRRVACEMAGRWESSIRPLQCSDSYHVCPICRELHTTHFCPNHDGGKMEDIVQRTLAQECPLCSNARRNCKCMGRKE